MALIEFDFRSQALNYHEEVVMTLPDDMPEGSQFPVLWLFHGANQDATEWLRQTSIERYANKRGLAVVCPTTTNGFGMDMVHGFKYFTMLSEELPAMLHYTFPCLSKKREENFTAGASMGGYIAYKLALNYPEKYCAAGAFAGALDIVEIVRDFTSNNDSQIDPFKLAFGSAEEIEGTNSDIIWLAGKLKEEGKELPRLWSLVGLQDFGAEQVKGAVAKFKAEGVEIDDLYDMGTHSFDLWDRYVEQFFDWLKLPKV